MFEFIWTAVIILCIPLFLSFDRVDGMFKMTKFFCDSYDPSWMVIHECRLRPINRNITKLYFNGTILQPAHVIKINAAVVQRATGGYKPFLVNFTIDACDYLIKPNNPVANIVYKLFKRYSNINHTCPYVGDQILNGFYARHDLFNVPMPNGDYGILLNWYFNNDLKFFTNVYFIFELKMNSK